MPDNAPNLKDPMYYIRELTKSVSRQVAWVENHKGIPHEGSLYRRQYEKYLGAGLLRTLIIDRFVSGRGKKRHTIGKVAIHISPAHSSNGTEYGSTALDIYIDPSTTFESRLMSNGGMPKESQREYEKWGYMFTREHSSMFGVAGEQTAIITRNLADIAIANEFATNIEAKPLGERALSKLFYFVGLNTPDFGHEDPYLPY